MPLKTVHNVGRRRKDIIMTSTTRRAGKRGGALELLPLEAEVCMPSRKRAGKRTRPTGLTRTANPRVRPESAKRRVWEGPDDVEKSQSERLQRREKKVSAITLKGISKMIGFKRKRKGAKSQLDLVVDMRREMRRRR
jgi:hypothetical protein